MDNKIDILITGVGGQGTILAGKVISQMALEKGLDVKLSETHGMAQRGGSVVTHVRLGRKVFSPLIPRGQADYLISFEQLEALRWLHYLNPEGTAIVNAQKLPPLPVLTGDREYPDKVLAAIEAYARSVIVINALKETSARRNPKVTNMVLIGILASHLDFPLSDWEMVLGQVLPPGLIEINLQAFKEGYEFGTRALKQNSGYQQ